MSAFTSDQPLGERQAAVMRVLAEHGGYVADGGWTWENASTTSTILRSLAKRGLVIVTGYPDSPRWKNYVRSATLSPAGRDWLAEHPRSQS